MKVFCSVEFFEWEKGRGKVMSLGRRRVRTRIPPIWKVRQRADLEVEMVYYAELKLIPGCPVRGM